jgi:peptide chain release factor
MTETKTFWVQISAGQGPTECELAVVKTSQEFLRDAAARSCSATVLLREAGAHPGTAKSVLIAVTGVQAEDWLRSWEGTVQWISPSPYRPHHGRKNWFIGVAALRPPDA